MRFRVIYMETTNLIENKIYVILHALNLLLNFYLSEISMHVWFYKYLDICFNLCLKNKYKEFA